VIQVGYAPVEAAAVLAAEAALRLTSLREEELELARDAAREPGISVVKPALLAAKLGATSLHDPTEGGLAAGLTELALASGLTLRVNESAVLWFEPGVAVCRALGADPWGALASGALLAAFPPENTEAALTAFEAGGFRARVIAMAERGTDVVLSDGTPLPTFERDEVARVLTAVE
jgi:hydrogenase maturation factor